MTHKFLCTNISQVQAVTPENALKHIYTKQHQESVWKAERQELYPENALFFSVSSPHDTLHGPNVTYIKGGADTNLADFDANFCYGVILK